MKQKRSLKNTLTAGGGPQNEFQDRLESYAEKHSLEQQEPQTLKNKQVNYNTYQLTNTSPV